jgi:CheY-like chemotaxis protein
VQLILSEWKMTPLDGLALFRHLREENVPSTKVKFILMTGREQRPLVEYALKAGIDGYIIKPFRLQALFDQIGLLLRIDADQQERQQSRLAPLTCLVANQHVASCEQMGLLLENVGFRKVLTAQSGPIALRILHERIIDVLIYDLNVKQPTWHDLQAELANLPRPPALLLTSVLPTQAELDEIRHKGVANFLAGPFRQAELLDAVLQAAGLGADKIQPQRSDH